jgi:DNA-binding transcriptional LysR family regulator
VTHGAVSRHVKVLEDSLGLPLLRRGPNGTVPTPEGQRLADALSHALALIQSTVEELRPGPLTLSCSESILMHWLLPRLARFQEDNRDVELRFNAGVGPVDFVRDNVSVAIRLSSFEPPKDAIRTDAVAEWIGPVCAPQYQRRVRIASSADLPRARAMTTRTRPQAWDDWRRHCGTPVAELRVDESFAHFYLLIQAAKCGLGLANVPRMLVLDDLNNGTLVAPLGFVPGPNKISVWLAPHLARRTDATRLVEWLVDELRTGEQGGTGTAEAAGVRRPR